MKKKKSPRIFIYLECSTCKNNVNKRQQGISKYITMKNRYNTPLKLELNKYCGYCNKHTLHKEIKF